MIPPRPPGLWLQMPGFSLRADPRPTGMKTPHTRPLKEGRTRADLPWLHSKVKMSRRGRGKGENRFGPREKSLRKKMK